MINSDVRFLRFFFPVYFFFTLPHVYRFSGEDGSKTFTTDVFTYQNLFPFMVKMILNRTNPTPEATFPTHFQITEWKIIRIRV